MKDLFRLIILLISITLIDFRLSKSEIFTKSQNYLMGFQKFSNKAQETKGKNRIILVGGSSLGWGISAKKLSENLKITTLNSGIHAGVGYKNYFRTIENYIDKNEDILVISPEYEMDINNRYFFKRSSQFCEITLFVINNYPIDCIGYSMTKIFKLINLIRKIDPEYQRDGFNEYGDYVLHYDKNKIINKFRDVCIDINLNALEEKYVTYWNEFKKNGYKVVYIPNLIPESACSKPEKLEKFHNILFKNFGVKGFENTKLVTKNNKLFYGSRYHLSKEGVEIKTNLFEDHLKSYLKDN